jgi:hypothetical protein
VLPPLLLLLLLLLSQFLYRCICVHLALKFKWSMVCNSKQTKIGSPVTDQALTASERCCK